MSLQRPFSSKPPQRGTELNCFLGSLLGIHYMVNVKQLEAFLVRDNSVLLLLDQFFPFALLRDFFLTVNLFVTISCHNT